MFLLLTVFLFPAFIACIRVLFINLLRLMNIGTILIFGVFQKLLQPHHFITFSFPSCETTAASISNFRTSMKSWIIDICPLWTTTDVQRTRTCSTVNIPIVNNRSVITGESARTSVQDEGIKPNRVQKNKSKNKPRSQFDSNIYSMDNNQIYRNRTPGFIVWELPRKRSEIVLKDSPWYKPAKMDKRRIREMRAGSGIPSATPKAIIKPESITGKFYPSPKLMVLHEHKYQIGLCSSESIDSLMGQGFKK